jgi:ABC-type polysaccharide/polyol phosphate export permease
MQTNSGRSFRADLRDALVDVANALRRWRIWTALGTHDIGARYRGSLLGPLWITIATGAMIGGMGVLYSQIFHMTLKDYLPWVAIGIVFWGLFTTLATDGCETFISSNGIIKQTSLPMFTFLGRMLTRNLITFAHQLIIVVVVMTLFGKWSGVHPASLLVGFALCLGNLVWLALFCGITSARFRDVPQIVQAVMQVLMFMTPVFWRADSVRTGRFVLQGNPFYHMIEAVRRPLLGLPHMAGSWLFLTVLMIIGWTGTFLLFARVRRRVVHYL